MDWSFFKEVTWAMVVQFFTAVGVITTAIVSYAQQRTTLVKVEQVHRLTNSMKDELIVALTEKLTAQFSLQISTQAREISSLKSIVANLSPGPKKGEA